MPPHNLPVQLSSFIGRQREIADVARLLRETRLLTLLGSGGIGKTRLALRLAADLVDTHPDLEVRILVWSVAVVHTPSAPLALLVGEAWQDHPRITLRLDTTHPIYASHHQKIVVIDDAVAFRQYMRVQCSERRLVL